MARQVLPIVGAVIGGIYGGPAGAQAGAMIGSFVGNAVDPQIIKGPDIGDGQQTTSQEGVPRPRVWGTGCVGGNIIDRGPLKKSIKKSRQGKSQGPVTKEEQFHMTYAIAVAAHKIDGIVRIWEDETLMYDVRTTDDKQVDDSENEKYREMFRLYLGTDDQLPDSELEAIHGVGNTPAFRGTAYIVFPNRNLTTRGGSVPNYRFEVSNSGTFTEYPDVFADNGSVSTLHRSEREVEFEYQGIDEDQAWNMLEDPDFSADGQYLIAKQNDQSTSNYPTCVWRLNRISNRYDIKCFELPYNLNNYSALKFHNKTNLLLYHNIENSSFDVYKPSADGNSFELFTQNDYGMDMTGCYISRFLIAYEGVTILMQFGNGRGYVIFNFDYSSKDKKINLLRWSPGDINFGGSSKSNVLMRQNFLYILVPTSSGGSGFTCAVDFYQITTTHQLKFINRSSNIGYAAGKELHWSLNKANFIAKVGTGYEDGKVTGIKLVKLVTINHPTIEWGFDFQIYDIPGPVDDNLRDTSINSFLQFGTNMSYEGRYLLFTTEKDYYAVYERTEASANFVGYKPIPKNGGVSALLNTQIISPVNGGAAFTGPWPVHMIIRDIADLLKIDLNVIDTTDVEGLMCRGLVAAQQYSGGNIIRKLQEAFIFDTSEHDEKMYFIRRGKDVVESFSYDMLVNDSYDFNRKSAIEYPRKIELIYQNPVVGYSTAKAFAERISPNVNVSGTQTQTTPITMMEDEAAQLVDKLHKIAWAEAEGEINLSLPDSYAHLTVADCIGFFTDASLNINKSSVGRRLRIESIETADGIMNLKCKVDRQTAYNSNATGVPVPKPTPPPATITGDTVFAYLDIPALIDTQDQLGYYVSGTGQTTAWFGATVERMNSTNEFDEVTDLAQGLVIGVLENYIAPASEHYVDTTNKVRVRLFHEYDTPESVTLNQLLQENNAFALTREDGSAELIQFKDAEDLGDQIWEMSYLIRGRLNSKATAHEEGALFVMLDDTTFVPTSVTNIGKTFVHRPVSYNQIPESAPIYQNPFVGRSQIEFPVDDVQINNGQVTWIPRERFGTDIQPIRSSNWLNYHVVINGNGNTLQVDTVEPFVDFDPSGFGSSPTATVYQNNRITGLGEPAQS